MAGTTVYAFESHLFSTINIMPRKVLILAVVYDGFLFHASIAYKLATDKPTGGHAAHNVG